MSDIQKLKKGGPARGGGGSSFTYGAGNAPARRKAVPQPKSTPKVTVPQPKSTPSVDRNHIKAQKNKKDKLKTNSNTNVGSKGKNKKKKTKETGLTAPATVLYSYDFPPILPDPSIPDPPPPPVRVPERDVIELLNQTVDSETIENLLFENIGANELTKFVRHDTVEGLNPYYNIISNLSDVKRKFNPASLISLQKNDSSLFDLYAIKLQDKVPTDDYLADNNLIDYVYFNENGDLIIEVVNMSDSEVVEVEIDRNGTIYEVEEP